jgi:hypothetical protein
MKNDHEEPPVTRRQDGARLYPWHRKLLKERYGLLDPTIDAWGCFSATKGDLISENFSSRVPAPGIALPIWPPGALRSDGFFYRPDTPRQVRRKNGTLRTAKYEHAVGATNHIHVPRVVQARLSGHDQRPVRTLVITEGPIKAEVAAQAGIACVALMGVWNFLQKRNGESVLIEDLFKIPWHQFEAVEICFDSDFATNPSVQNAARRLAEWLLK